MEFVVKGVEATRENSGSEEHDGLPSVLREASARSLHSRPDDGFRGGFGDAGTDRVVARERVGVVHAATAVLVLDVVDGSVDVGGAGIKRSDSTRSA